jgi:hypothetical protein
MRSMILMAALCVGACATTYTPPAAIAPDIWHGESGVRAVENSLEVFDGELAEGGLILRYQIAPRRTARTVADVTYGSESNPKTLPAGTLLYAQQFSLQRTVSHNYGAGYTTNMNRGNNPIEWCAPYTPEGNPICIFWEAPDRARYIDAVIGAPLAAQPLGTTGAPGGVPEIVEEDVEFPHPLYRELRVEALRSNRIRLAYYYSEGDYDRRSRLLPRMNWEETGVASWGAFGGEFSFTRVENNQRRPDFVNVEILTAPNDPGTRLANLPEGARMLTLPNGQQVIIPAGVFLPADGKPKTPDDEADATEPAPVPEVEETAAPSP